MKKLLSVLLVTVMLLTAIPIMSVSANAATSGTTGDCTWTLDANGHLTVSGNGAMEDYSFISPWSDKITAVTIKKGVTYIGEYAFAMCNRLSSVTIADSVKTIGDGAFACCTQLSAIDIPNSVIEIGQNAFGDTKLTSVSIPGSVKTIGWLAFSNNSSLVSVSIEDGVTTIGAYAFQNCRKLNSVNIPDTVTYIGHYVFSNTAYMLNESNWEGGYLYIGKHLIAVSASITDCNVKDGTLTIAAYSGYDKKIESLVVPNSVKTIGAYAFSMTPLKWAKLGSSVTFIGSGAFLYCRILKMINLPKSIATIDDGAFDLCDELADVYYGGSKSQKSNINVVGEKNNYLLNATWHYDSCIDKEKHVYTNSCDATCNKCGATRSASHTYTAATCTKAKTCKVCGATSGKALGHKYTTVTKKATTSANGYTVKRCSVCDKETGKKTLYKVSSVTLSKTSYTYNGKVQKPTVTVKNANGVKLTEGTSYTVTYSSGCKNAGTYKVTIKLKGNYSGTVTKTFKIKPVDVSKCKITLSATSYTYNGAVKKPTVTVKNAAGTKLTEGGSYTVTYATGRKNVGTYKVTIKMKGNYTGTKTITFKILPTKTSISSLTAGSKKLTVKWARKTTQVSGYEIQYSTSKTFASSVKTKTITKNSTVSTSLTGLSAKKTYYVRIRTYKTVNGVKIYSGWSTVKSLKTK